jgi:hypothetical protein
MKLSLACLDNPQISNFTDSALRPDQAGKIDCADIGKFDLHLIHGFEASSSSRAPQLGRHEASPAWRSSASSSSI